MTLVISPFKKKQLSIVLMNLFKIIFLVEWTNIWNILANLSLWKHGRVKIIMEINIIKIKMIQKDGSFTTVQLMPHQYLPEWHSWLHKIIKTTPDQVKFNNFNWQKEHKKNLTGTSQAYVPQHEKKLPYKRWQPK